MAGSFQTDSFRQKIGTFDSAHSHLSTFLLSKLYDLLCHCFIKIKWALFLSFPVLSFHALGKYYLEGL